MSFLMCHACCLLKQNISLEPGDVCFTWTASLYPVLELKAHHHSQILCRVWSLNSGPLASMVNTLSHLSPHPSEFYLVMMSNNLGIFIVHEVFVELFTTSVCKLKKKLEKRLISPLVLPSPDAGLICVC